MVSSFEFASHVVGIMITSEVDQKLLKKIHEVIKEKFIDHQRINLFVEISPGTEIPLKIVFKDLIFKLGNASRFNKIAVVSDPGFFQKAMKLEDLLMHAEVETYCHQDRIKAITWITE